MQKKERRNIMLPIGLWGKIQAEAKEMEISASKLVSRILADWHRQRVRKKRKHKGE